MKIFAVCQSGLGTSFMAGINIKQALADLGTNVDEFEVSRTDIESVSSDIAGYFFIEHSLEDTLASIPNKKLVSLQSIIDSEEVEGKVAKILLKG